MSEDVFRWVVSVGVVVACLAFVFHAVILAAVYRAGREAQKAGKDIQGKVGPIIDRCQAIVETTSRILDENRPRVAEITTEAEIISKVVRQQAERIGELIDDANARAHTRIAQIDHAVDQTIGQVEQVSETVKSAVLRPAKEVNGILNGVKAAVNTYAEGRRRPSVDHATQDEEMFI
jgi:ABC-type transporter Mla subunit MlaD